MRDVLVLRRPRCDEGDEFLRAHRATTPEVPYFLHYYDEQMSLSRYLEVLEDCERGLNLPVDHVPSTFLFAFTGGRIVGRVAIRHRLNDALERIGGHIGFVVVPEFRRRGYATEILRLALLFAHEKLGLDHLLITCNDDNIGSIRAIEKNGGVLESVLFGPDMDKPKRRYWVKLQR